MEILSQGLIFAADRNITGYDCIGNPLRDREIRKVIKWPNSKAIFGFVGAAKLGNLYIDEWMNNFIEDNTDFISLKLLSEKLCRKIQEQRNTDEGDEKPSPLIIHIGGFEEREGFKVPEIWFIRNVHGMGVYKYEDISKKFACSEAFWDRFPLTLQGRKAYPNEVRMILGVMAKKFRPFWFHHGFDLATFNTMEENLKSTLKILCENHPNHEYPKTLKDWEKILKMQILMYDAYFEAFYPENERFVGGGVNVESIAWPD